MREVTRLLAVAEDREGLVVEQQHAAGAAGDHEERCTADGHPAREDDIARLSVYIRRHLNVEGRQRHSFQLPELAGARRPLRDPDTADEEHA